MSGALLAQAAIPAFARHETFHPRFGWLRKAYTSTVKDPAAFQQATATVELGVGKNMVNAIRYWGQAFKVLQEAPNPDRPRMPLLVPTEFGDRLFADDGWDPYLEDPASLWLLHWQLLSPRTLAPAWWVAFHDFTPWQFTEHQLTEHIVELVDAAGWPQVVPSSVKKDVDCILRTYTARRQGRAALDDLLDCPFRELGLIEAVPGDGKQWRFVIGDKATLPDVIVAYACLDFAGRDDDGAGSISVARLATDAGSPGRAFRLPETALFAALHRAGATLGDAVALAEPGGLRQLLWHEPPTEITNRFLDMHYASAHSPAEVPA